MILRRVTRAMTTQDDLFQEKIPIARMTAQIPGQGEVRITWAKKHGVWFLMDASAGNRSVLSHLFRDVLTEPGFRQFCRRTGTTYEWDA